MLLVLLFLMATFLGIFVSQWFFLGYALVILPWVVVALADAYDEGQRRKRRRRAHRG